MGAMSRLLNRIAAVALRVNAELETGRIMHTRIPKLIAEINTIIADHSDSDLEEMREAIELLKRARHKLGLARAKLQEADLKKHRLAAGQ